ncbi:MAG: DNA damage-inducible protein D [Ktedonobacteraceae bacterium]|nr:DNA damage-inducible protein D [Ktedonobacteraceae bacterium]
MSRSPDFESIKQINVYGMEYWSARDLMPLLGYGRKWQNFEGVAKKAMTACVETDNRVEDHFTDASKPIAGGRGAVQHVKDYYLSRLACYLIAQNGDPRKSEIAAAQVYFAVSTRAHEMHQLREDQEKRLEARLKVSESYKQLAKAAHHAGVQSETFGIFVDAGYLGLHRHTLQELKERKGIPEQEDYLDRIGREELSAIDFKNALTERKLQDDQVTGLDEASNTHYFVGDQIRQTIERIRQPMPEDMPTGPSIRKMVEERRRATKKRKLKANPRSREHCSLFQRKLKANPQEQGTLFDVPEE